MRRISLALATGLLAAAAWFPATAAADDDASATLVDVDGDRVGTVELTETPNGTLIEAELSGLPSGVHGFHVHETGRCEAPFESAGGHYDPDGNEHGFLSDGGMHAGDMPNIRVPDSGVLEVEMLNTRLALDDRLLDEDGAAIVVHSGADDYETDPAGNAGSRIACGVIEG